MGRKYLGVPGSGQDLITFDQLSDKPQPATSGWFQPQGIITTAAGLMTSGTLKLVPIWISNSIAINAIGTNVTTAIVGGTYTMTLVCYKSGPTNFPDVTVGAVASGNIVPTPTGQKVVSLSTTLSRGMYWIGMFYFASVAPTTPSQLTCISSCTTLPAVSASLGTVTRYIQRTGLTTIPLTTPTDATYTYGTDALMPVVGLRAA